MKAIMADDENLIRSGLRSMLNELDIPVEVIGEAKNGEDLAAMVETLAPDLVFADIRMPRLSGLEALRKVKEKTPHTLWVMLTGFADFEYAREALRLGAINYLLKPVTPEDLAACVAEAFEKQRFTIAGLNRMFESELISMIQNTRAADEFDAKHLLKQFHYRGTLCCFDSFVGEQEKAHLRKRFVSDLCNLAVEQMTSRSVRYGCATLPSGNFSIFTAWDASLETSEGVSRNEKFEANVANLISLYSNDRFTATALRTDVCHDIGTVLLQLSELVKLSSLRNVVSLGTVHLFYEFTTDAQCPGLAGLSQRLEAVCRLFTEKDFVQFAKEVTLLEKEFSPSYFQDRKTLMAACDYLYYSINCRLHEVRDRTVWFAALSSHGESMLAERANESKLQGDLIRQVVTHVNQHYMNDIGIGQIAADINVTPNYLSTLFHKRYGMTFMKLLTETRMLKAKELLLSDPSRKIQQVAEDVGYYSTRHFTKLFKDYYGYYPSDAREIKKDTPK